MTAPRPDESARDRAQRRLAAEYVAARALAESATLAEATPRVLRAICEALDWEHGALWNLDADANVLRCVETWHRPGIEFPAFDAISRSTSFAPGSGLPGRVWASGEPAWIPDVVEDTNFPRAPIADREGLHAALGVPLLIESGNAVVMEFFSRQIREPDEELLKMLATVGMQIGQLIKRRRAEEELDRFFALSLDMLCVAGFDGHFRRLNPAWERVLGYRREELIARPYLDFVHPDDREATLAEARKLAGGADVVSFENRYRCRDGSYRWLQWVSTPFPAEQVIYAVARDVSERKAAGEALARYAHDLDVARQMHEEDAVRLAQLVTELEVARRQAEAATHAKGEFLANMSHEIRTPLNAVLGMTDLALGTHVTAEQRGYFGAVRDAADALRAIVDDTLDLSKIEARRLDLEHVNFGLRDTVEDTVRVLALRAEQKGLELACHVAPEAPDALTGDPGRLRQVIVNLVGNAIKFTERGEVVLDVRADSLTTDRVQLHLTVADTGIGIPPAKQAQIFEPFAQADSSTTRTFGGTGLGLAIAARLVDLMGGSIWVDSQVGRGSTFHFTASLERQRPAADAHAAGRPVRLEGLRVLIVDDNATNRRILEEMLSSWRMRPAVAADGAGALTALKNARAAGQAFELVIADHQMPGMDGVTLTRRIRKGRRLAHLPVLMLTSLAHPEHVARCRKVGVAACLTKPVKQSDLLDAILTLFGKRLPRPSTRPRRAEPVALRHAQGDAEQRRSLDAREPAVAAAPQRGAALPRGRTGVRVLVAEDNAVNRKLVSTILKKAGHTVATAANGRTALAALDGQATFDVILMDVQMPGMDGFAATAAIRARERGSTSSPHPEPVEGCAPTLPRRSASPRAGRGATSSARVPIVAMTARAMAGDRERCLDAGMDAYLSKPIQAQQLLDTIDRLADPARRHVDVARRPPEPVDGRDSTSSARPEPVDGRTTFDEEAALSRTGGDRRLLRELIAVFLADYPKTLRKLRRGVASNDGRTVREAAHALKGSIATFGALPATAAAATLEAMGARADLEGAAEACAGLEDELARLRVALKRVKRTSRRLRRRRTTQKEQ